MAGERKGKTYEAIVRIVLDDLLNSGYLTGRVFWNEKPDLMTIEPDLTVGMDKNSPSHVFLVTHSSSTKDSEKKFWRNMGELVEAKVRLSAPPMVFALAFDSEIKEDLKLIQASAFDGQLVAGDIAYGIELQRWVETNEKTLPADRDEKEAAVRDCLSRLSANNPFKLSVSLLTHDLQVLVASSRSDLDTLWKEERDRNRNPSVVAKFTAVKRGMTKAALVYPVSADFARLPNPLPGWLEMLGLAGKSIAGYKITDPELNWLLGSGIGRDLVQTVASTIGTTGFQRQLEKVRGLALIDQFLSYVVTNLATLQTSHGMLGALRAQRADPAHGLTIPLGTSAPSGVWLFDAISAVIKATKGMAQGFGYSYFAKHPRSKDFLVGKMPVGTWVSCFVNQYFSRKPGFVVQNNVEEYIADVLSDALKPLTPAAVQGAAESVLRQYISKEYEATLLSHRGFDPIGYLVSETPMLPTATKIRVRGGFAERALDKGISGSTSVLKVKNTIIKWQSVTDSGRDHKKKELCGRAVAIRYSWDEGSQSFRRVPGIDKLILVVDGTWRQEDLDALIYAGWDDIFYPDELDKLVQAIV